MPPTKKRATKAKPTLPKRGPGRPKKAQSTSASGKAVPSSELAKKATPAAAVVGIFFRETLEMTTFENAEDAEAFHLKLPRSTRSKSDVVFFHSQGECDDYITNMKLDTKTSPPPVTPEKQSLPRLNVTIKQENPYKKSSAVATSTGALYQKLQSRKQTYGSRFKLHVFVTTPDRASAKVYMYEFQETKADFNHWCHKPITWAYVFESDEECAPQDQQFEEWLHGQQACVVRDPRATTEETPKQIVKRGRQGDYTITNFGLYGLVPLTCTDDDVIAMLRNSWTKIVDSDEAQLCYHSMIEAESDKVFQATKPLSSDPKCHYWNQVKGAIDSVVVETHHSLDEVFMKPEIDTILASLFDFVSE